MKRNVVNKVFLIRAKMDTHKDHEKKEVVIVDNVMNDYEDNGDEEVVVGLEAVHEFDCLGGTCTVTPLGYRLWHYFTLAPCVPCS